MDLVNEVKGIVSDLTGTCPRLTFTAHGVRVTTSSSTRFDGGCDTLQNGVRVEVTGMKLTDGSVVASHVEIDVASQVKIEN